MAKTGAKHTDDVPEGIVIIQATSEGFELKISQNLNYDQAKHLLVEALHVIGIYEKNSCIPDNMVLQ